MKYARRAHRKLRKRIIGIADDLLVRGIDITAAINNPVETLRGRPTISGRKMANIWNLLSRWRIQRKTHT